MEITRRYSFKLYPTKAQIVALERQCVLLARLWNAALEQREIQWAHECQTKRGDWKEGSGSKRHVYMKGERSSLSYYDQSKQLKIIRAEDPEYKAMSSASLELTLAALDLAFKAFFKRAKGGAGISSGYPRYKNMAKHGTIWHRDGSGWKMRHDTRDKWFIYAKGIPGEIRARGRFPFENFEYRTMELIKRDDAWWISVVVRTEGTRVRGDKKIEVDFDLIDEFAEVKILANGECLSGCDGGFYPLEERNVSNFQGVQSESGSGTSETGASGRLRAIEPLAPRGSGTSGTGANGGQGDYPCDGLRGYGTPENGDNGRISELSFGVGEDSVISENRANGRSRRQPDRSRSGLCTLENGDDGRLKNGRKPYDLGSADIDREEVSDIQSKRDLSRKKFSYRWKKEKRAAAKAAARLARKRRDDLHKWTSTLMSHASEISVIAPEIAKNIKTARGDEKNPGAAVDFVAKINRRVLSLAPALAIDMMKYKALEADIPFVQLTPDEHAFQVGRAVEAGVKTNRRLRRELRKEVA